MTGIILSILFGGIISFILMLPIIFIMKFLHKIGWLKYNELDYQCVDCVNFNGCHGFCGFTGLNGTIGYVKEEREVIDIPRSDTESVKCYNESC